MNDLIITIDGPAGAGKSTVARNVSKLLGWNYLDTGAIYRAYTLASLRKGLTLGAEGLEEEAVLAAVSDADVRVDWAADGNMHVSLGDEDVSQEIRTEHVTSKIRYVADMGSVRALSNAVQRKQASQGKFVCEGRDQGTEVFPDAFLKIYLWATPEERARRRHAELVGTSEEVELEPLLRRIMVRDRLDMSREIGALKKAADAIEVDTSPMTIEESVEFIVKLARERLATLS